MRLNESKKCKDLYQYTKTAFTRPANKITVTCELIAHILDWTWSNRNAKMV